VVGGQRLAPARLLALVGTDLLFRDELGGSVLLEHQLEQREGELAIVLGDALGFLAQEPPLELLALLPQLLVEGLVLIAGGNGRSEGVLEVGHAGEEIIRRGRHGSLP
jgi:hypothetical protein